MHNETAKAMCFPFYTSLASTLTSKHTPHVALLGKKGVNIA